MPNTSEINQSPKADSGHKRSSSTVERMTAGLSSLYEKTKFISSDIARATKDYFSDVKYEITRMASNLVDYLSGNRSRKADPDMEPLYAAGMIGITLGTLSAALAGCFYVIDGAAVAADVATTGGMISACAALLTALYVYFDNRSEMT